MEVISLMVGILGLCVGIFAFGYQIGKDSCMRDCGKSYRNKDDKSQK